MQQRLNFIDPLLRETIDRLDEDDQQPDVPLHQRGFGVMEGPPA